ncbi:Signal peptidase I [Paenibacillus taihuensis]|uniref:Signal peptidase I n=1 Tax=Paenibacillus taihuensis TaxID=1156355 RepID=A0A3D9SJS3_9BACL|nr:signal peptidase I [Paenibacillus taihuensis]REE90553.1 Signal peptidase I [Paenibacillus taihuensis]
MRVKKWVSNFVTGVLLVLMLAVGLAVFASKSGGESSFFGYQLKTVLSGSMEPGIKTGSIIAIKPIQDASKLKKGDVITFRQVMNGQEIVITHRIIDVLNTGNGQVMYQTKGDNNPAPDTDKVLSQNVVATYSGFTVPQLGYFIDFAKSKPGSLWLLIVPGVLLILYSITNIWKIISKLEIKPKESKADSNVSG